MNPWTGGQVNSGKYFLKIYIFLIDGMSVERPKKYFVCLLCSSGESQQLTSKTIKILQTPFKDLKSLKILWNLVNNESLQNPRQNNDDDSEFLLCMRHTDWDKPQLIPKRQKTFLLKTYLWYDPSCIFENRFPR